LLNFNCILQGLRSPMLSKDCWRCIVMHCEWPEVWALSQVCRASYAACLGPVFLRARFWLWTSLFSRFPHTAWRFSVQLEITNAIKIARICVINERQKRNESIGCCKDCGEDYCRFWQMITLEK
jgi:hypothetical protein